MSKLNRRMFIAGSTAAGALGLIGGKKAFAGMQEKAADLAVTKGENVSAMVGRAIDELGGMGVFVQPGQSVGILLNGVGKNDAAHTKPEVLGAVAALCRSAGAASVTVLSWLEQDRWDENKMDKKIPTLGADFLNIDPADPDQWQVMKNPDNKYIPEIRVIKALYEPDVIITLPVFKHHGAARFSGALKLALATTMRVDNRTYIHQQQSKYIEQAIAELNTIIRKPDLVIMDATKVLMSGGPHGPGKISKPGIMVAGTDRVAIDTYCAPIHNINPADPGQILSAYELGLGEMDLGKLVIREIDVV